MIVGKNVLQRVKDGIVKSCEVGMYPVKINMVVMNNINNDEIMDMFEFTKKHGVILQLIEIIESESCDDNDFNSKYHYPLAEFEEYLAEIADDVRVRPFMQDRKKYFIDGGEIEVVHPVDNTNFCKNCTRLRITPEGKIKPCLLRNDNLVDLIGFIREGASDEELVDTVRRGFFGDDELVRIYYGTLRLGINLNKAEEDWIKVEKDTIICKLPPIELLDENFIDEAQTRSFFEEGKWNAKDKQKLYERARTMMRKRCMTKANISTAEENAKEQFSKMLTSIGNKNVKVTFEEK